MSEQIIETSFGNCVIREYTIEDQTSLIKLWGLAYNSKVDPALWRWKFHDNPYGNKIVVCFTGDGEPIVMYGGIPFYGYCLGRKIRIGQIMDVMTHPRFRSLVSGRKGLFALTADYFFKLYGGEENCSFLMGFPGQKAFRLGNMLLGYQKAGNGSVYLKCNIPDLRYKSTYGFYNIRKLNFATSDLDILFRRALRYYPLTICRDREFVNWRFFKNPQKNYHVYLYQNYLGSPLGYLIISIRDGVATIVDVLTINEPLIIQRLIGGATADLQKNEVQWIQTWLPANHFLANQLINLGMRIAPEPMGIIPAVKQFEGVGNVGPVLKDLFYTMGDGDLF